MQIFKKEKKVVELALRHVDLTRESLGIMAAAVKAAASDDLSGLDSAAKSVNRLETDADEALRDIRDLLYSGAYLPTIRGDLYRLLSAVDKITNRIEGCVEFVSSQKPLATDGFGEEVNELLDLTVACFDHLELALRAFFKPKGRVDDLREHSRAVGDTESRVDKRERALIAKIFSSDMPLAEKQHIAEMVSRITRISDQIENTADELELLSLKSII